MKAIIMCGGSGTRLWPLSRKSSPKQFVPIFNGKSLFQLTIERNISLVNEFIIVVNEKQLPLCKKQIPQILKDKVTYIIEPIGRNTAPAITLAALTSQDDQLLVLASDHIIKNEVEYTNCIKRAQAFANEGNLVTFGITPHYPETGYGYIQYEENKVLSFKEKPNLETAKNYLKEGNYLWNSGMFLFNSKTFLNEIKKFTPEIAKKSSDALEKATKKDNVFYIDLNDMKDIPEDSIDYAVMEKSESVMVVPSNINWNDLGSFDSLAKELDNLEKQNSNLIFSHASENNFILPNKRVIATFDINDLIIVDTEDALLIGKKDKSQNVKKLLEKVKISHPKLLD